MISSLHLIVSFLIILIFSLILSIQDIKHMEVGIYIQWTSVYAALICHLILARESLWLFIISSMIMGAIAFFIRKITKNKLGPADVWFAFFQGLFLFPKFIPLCILIQALAALIIENKKFRKQSFPFIPYMSASLIISFLLQTLI
ncbi:MAG: prepilin peptidase [Treponema sp.]|nr:prepilin peptidase [Treponema sp.]